MKKYQLSKTEEKVIKLIGYETRESKFSWNSETRKADIPNPEYVKKNRDAIRKALKEHGLENIRQLFTKLNNERKAREAEAEKHRREENRISRAQNKVRDIINNIPNETPVFKPTKKMAAEYIRYRDFKNLTGFARRHFINAYVEYRLEKIWDLAIGAHENYFYVCYGNKVELTTDVENDWEVYSKSTKYPAHHYAFTLTLPKDHSFLKYNGHIVVFKGRSLNANGAEVVYLSQARGMNVKEVPGFVVHEHIFPKSKSIQTVADAVEKYKRLTAKKVATKLRA